MRHAAFAFVMTAAGILIVLLALAVFVTFRRPTPTVTVVDVAPAVDAGVARQQTPDAAAVEVVELPAAERIRQARALIASAAVSDDAPIDRATTLLAGISDREKKSRDAKRAYRELEAAGKKHIDYRLRHDEKTFVALQKVNRVRLVESMNGSAGEVFLFGPDATWLGLKNNLCSAYLVTELATKLRSNLRLAGITKVSCRKEGLFGDHFDVEIAPLTLDEHWAEIDAEEKRKARRARRAADEEAPDEVYADDPDRFVHPLVNEQRRR